MTQKKYKIILENLFKTNKRFLDEAGEIREQLIKNLAQKYDAELLQLLLSNENIKAKFFINPTKDIWIFKLNDFQFFLDENKIQNSFTQFKNKIGLAIGDTMLAENRAVVLNFPFKDSILEGGQRTEDGMENYYEFVEKASLTEQKKGIIPNEFNLKTRKRKEVFFNEVLAKDEIDCLIEPKAFKNIKKYTTEGEMKLDNFNRNERGTIADNLIIKGNNLLVLNSLKKVFKNKIKFIYIDPPYNTGSDSFRYNDNFNHSTWLVFMKNRLEAAQKLMKLEDGIIAIQCSFHQYAYLKVLCNEIFEKHLCDFNIQVRHPDRALTGDKEYNDVIEYILIYANNINQKMPFKEEVKTVDAYKYEIEIKAGEKPIKTIQCDDKLVEVYLPNQYEVKTIEPNKNGLKRISIRGTIREKNSSGRFYVKHLEQLDLPNETLFKVPNMGDDAVSHRFFYAAPKGKKMVVIIKECRQVRR